MKQLIILFFLLSNISFSQSNEKLINDFLLEDVLKEENLLEEYSHFNFSKVWTKTENRSVLGIIGENHQRIRIKLISVFRISNNPLQYTVYGKSKVKNNICEFYGQIVIKEIKETKELHFGVDKEFENEGIQSQGILIADYEFFENKAQKHSGIFKGKLYSKWYLNSKNEIEYDKIQFIADGYTNNMFVGIWKSYESENEKICNWGDYRVPNSKFDFDVGAAEFYPNKKYFEKGWSNYDPNENLQWWK